MATSPSDMITVSMPRTRLESLVQSAWHDSAVSTAARVADALHAAGGRYVSSFGWTHIFSEDGREVERETRWIYDRETKALVILDIKRDQKWREASDAEKADVLDSLVNGNPGCLDNPDDWDFEVSAELVDWD